jgi:hypothetical protein
MSMSWRDWWLGSSYSNKIRRDGHYKGPENDIYEETAPDDIDWSRNHSHTPDQRKTAAYHVDPHAFKRCPKKPRGKGDDNANDNRSHERG